MSLADKWNQYKAVIGLVVSVVIATVGVIAWAADAKEDAIITMKAQSALIHDNYYQEGRIARKQDQVTENQRELDNLLEYIGDDEPTFRQNKEIDYLDKEIARLREEIEEIRVLVTTGKEE